jgi:hypothetical protein
MPSKIFRNELQRGIRTEMLCNRIQPDDRMSFQHFRIAIYLNKAVREVRRKTPTKFTPREFDALENKTGTNSLHAQYEE